MRAKHANWLAALHKQGFVGAQVFELAHDGVETIPVARRLPRAAVHDEIGRTFGDVGVEIVHQHPQRRFLLPSLARDTAAARGAHRSTFACRRFE